MHVGESWESFFVVHPCFVLFARVWPLARRPKYVAIAHSCTMLKIRLWHKNGCWQSGWKMTYQSWCWHDLIFIYKFPSSRDEPQELCPKPFIGNSRPTWTKDLLILHALSGWPSMFAKQWICLLHSWDDFCIQCVAVSSCQGLFQFASAPLVSYWLFRTKRVWFALICFC